MIYVIYLFYEIYQRINSVTFNSETLDNLPQNLHSPGL